MESRYTSLLPLMGMGLVSAVCAAVLALGFKATADQDPTTDDIPMFIPYNGVLELDGQRVDATDQWLRFELEDTDNDRRRVVYSEDLQIDIYAGRFTAVLGSSAPGRSMQLRQVFQAADNIYVRITVLGNHDPNDPASTADDDVVLSNPKRLVMNPHAIWASHATDFDIAGTLNSPQITSTTADTFRITTTPENGILRIQPNGGSVRVGAEDSNQENSNAQFDIPTLPDGSFVRFGRFMIDSDHDGTNNLLAGANPLSSGGHVNYPWGGGGQRGNSRIQMTNGELRLQAGDMTGSGPSAVAWNPGMTVANNGVSIQNILNIQDNGNNILRVSDEQTPYKSVFTGSASIDTAEGNTVGAAQLIHDSGVANISGSLNLLGILSVSELTSFNNTATITGAATFNGALNHTNGGAGRLNAHEARGVGLNAYRRQCGGEWCPCWGADDMAISGGGFANSDGVLRESRVRYDPNSARWGWLTNCTRADGPDEGNDYTCDGTDVICIGIKPGFGNGNVNISQFTFN